MNNQPKLDVEVYCNPKVLMGLGQNARINTILTDLGKATVTYKGGFEMGFNEIPRKPGDLASICQYGLPDSYIRGKIDDVEEADTNLILIQRDINKSGSAGSVRSISLIRVTYNPEQQGHVGSQETIPIEIQDDSDISPETTDMEVLVLGSQKIPNVKSRAMQSKIYARGGNTLKAIQFLGSKLKHGIVLYGLETVITLYYKFGWRFISRCGDVEERCKYAPAVKALYLFLKTNGVPGEEGIVRSEESEIQYNTELTNLLKPFSGFAHNMYGILSKSQVLEEPETKATSQARESSRDDGYRMLLCQKLNPFSSVNKRRKTMKGGDNENEASFEQWVESLGEQCVLPRTIGSSKKRKRGGTKKRRRKKTKRTKKKALKKRHPKSKKKKKSKHTRHRKKK